MLYLEAPFEVIEGISIFSDHADPLQFYYMPLMPHFTTIEDSVSGVKVPQLQLIKYKGDAGNGGFLNFDVNLGIDPELLKTIARKLRTKNNLTAEPRVVPVPLIDGTVKLMLLDRETGDTPPEDSETGPRFVQKISHYAKPSLYGDNQAAFSVALDQNGVTVLEKAMQGEMSPIGVVYSLDYLALRPAYSVRVSADWDRVQHHLQDSFGTNFLVFSSQIDKVVDELIESQAIKLEIDSFIPPGDNAAELLGRLDRAINEVKDMVLENFFEPSVQPITDEEEEDGWDKAAGFAERIALMHARGGHQPLFTMKKVDITRIDRKRLDVNMTERTTVVRSIFPQGHLQGLFQLLRDGGVTMSRFVTEVDLDDPWFRERRVNVIARANFSTDNVESVNVRLEYDGDAQNAILDAANPQKTLKWNSELVNGAEIKAVKASYKVSFKNVDASERPVSLSSPEVVIDTENYEIRPHELYSLVPVSIIALDFPWTVYPHVEVQVRYTDTAHQININETFLLNQQKTSDIWNLFALDPARRNFQYKLIFRSADHRDVERPWADNDTEKIIIRDPYPVKRRLQVVPAFNWTEVENVFVDVTYEDRANSIREDQSVNFNPNAKDVKTVEVRQFVNPEHRFMTYKTTIISKDGTVRETPSSVTLAERAIITPQMRGHKILSVLPEAVPFADRGIKEFTVLVKYEDAQAGLSFTDSFRFASHQDRPRYFEYDYADPNNTGCQYQITYLHTNGLQRVSDWKTSDEDTLTVTTA
ncbi:hypothetical protein [Larkinella arboricola]